MSQKEEEIARAKEIAHAILNENKKRNGLRSLKVGRFSIFFVAFLFLVSDLYFYSINAPLPVLGVVTIFLLAYVALGVVFYRNPFVISSIALALFLIPQILSVIADARSLFSGFLIKGLIIAALISSVVNAKKYQNQIRKNDKERDDILDTELL